MVIDDEQGAGENKEAAKLRMLEECNHLVCSYLTGIGLGGGHFKAFAPKAKKLEKVTVAHSEERIEALKKASTAGAHFHATGGEVLNCDDVFVAKQKKMRDSKMFWGPVLLLFPLAPVTVAITTVTMGGMVINIANVDCNAYLPRKIQRKIVLYRPLVPELLGPAV